MQNRKDIEWKLFQRYDEGCVYISSNGAIKLTRFNRTAQEEFVCALTKAQAEMLLGIDLASVLSSEEYNATLQTLVAEREAKRMETEVERQVKREQLKIQASLEKLGSLGVNVKVG